MKVRDNWTLIILRDVHEVVLTLSAALIRVNSAEGFLQI